MKLSSYNLKELSGYSINAIVADMNKQYPQSKFSNGKSYQEIAKEYVDVCVLELLNNIDDNQQISEISLVNITSKLSYRYNKKHYWHNYLIENYPLWIETQKGYHVNDSNYSLTKIDCLISVKELMEYRLNYSFAHLFEQTNSNTVKIPIDTTSLQNFIATVMLEHKYKYVAQAINIFDRTQNGYLEDCVEITKNQFGASRMYHKGFCNMQGVSSIVREAALGDCVKYDINSAVFTYMMNVIKTFEPDTKTPYLMKIITEKSSLRKQLVKDCIQNTVTTPDHAVKMIKKAITALSFGATPSNPQGGIAKAIYDKQDLLRFGMHPFIKGLRKEIKQYNNHMRKHIKKGKMTTISSHHYQYTESECIREIIKNTNADALMTVHDCVYVKRSIRDAIDMQRTLEKYFGPHAKMERKDISAWQNRSKWEQNEQAIQQHYENIQQEEQVAKNYTSANSIIQTTTEKDEFDKRLELKRTWQELTKNHA